VSWQTLGAISPKELVDARLQLHHAAQIVASAGVTFIEPRPDDSHPNLGWDDATGTLLSHALPGDGARVGLRIADLSLVLTDARGEITDAFTLEGKTLDDGYTWLAEASTHAGVAMPQGGLVRASYEIPSHATGNGAPFSMQTPAAFEDLARWFANGHHALVEQAAHMAGTSDVRCWPHHFDVGSLSVIATASDGSLAKSIGLGLSPGDEGYAEPYWYVSPWPYPAPESLPALEAGGHWHTEGHTSAILTATHLLAGSAEGQGDRLRAFLESAVEASRRTLAD
jgi:hypothetical protein